VERPSRATTRIPPRRPLVDSRRLVLADPCSGTNGSWHSDQRIPVYDFAMSGSQDEVRYQVFVSSIFTDLKEERGKVLQAILESKAFQRE
jgi:hypothetical protein